MPSEQVRNADIDWGRFDPERYRLNNYEFVRAEDRRLTELAALSFKQLQPGALVLDVGTGSNLYPLLAALPRAAQLTAWEWGATNVEWLRATLAKPIEPVWREFWGVIRAAYGEAGIDESLIGTLGAKTRVVQGSIFDLPERQWDASSMFFCAESITSDRQEFEAAMAAWCCAVKSGGVLVGAFMEKSGGYQVGGEHFPAFALDADQLRAVTERIADVAHLERVPIVQEIRHGYDGMLFMAARVR